MGFSITIGTGETEKIYYWNFNVTLVWEDLTCTFDQTLPNLVRTTPKFFIELPEENQDLSKTNFEFVDFSCTPSFHPVSISNSTFEALLLETGADIPIQK